MGKFIHFNIGCGFRLSSFSLLDVQFATPLFTSLSTILAIGAFITTADVGILWGCPRLFLYLLISPLTLEILCISVPKKNAFPLAALVISVFSWESSNFSSSFKNFAIFVFSSCAKAFGPATPISQSSAYLT